MTGSKLLSRAENQNARGSEKPSRSGVVAVKSRSVVDVIAANAVADRGNQLFLRAIERGDGHHYILMMVITGESHVSRERVEPLRHHVTG